MDEEATRQKKKSLQENASFFINKQFIDFLPLL